MGFGRTDGGVGGPDRGQSVSELSHYRHDDFLGGELKKIESEGLKKNLVRHTQRLKQTSSQTEEF